MIPYLIMFLALLCAGAFCMTVSPIIKGITTIRWGSASTIGTPSTVIVQSGRITPKNGAPIEIEDMNGFTNTLVFLDDGFDADLDVMYDTALTWPAVADTVALTLPKIGAVGGTQAYNCFMASFPPMNIERKKEAMITIKLIYRPNCPAS